MDERTKTRRGTGPAPFSLFGHTHLVSPIICFAVFSNTCSPCFYMYIPSSESSQTGELDRLIFLNIYTERKQLCRKSPISPLPRRRSGESTVPLSTWIGCKRIDQTLSTYFCHSSLDSLFCECRVYLIISWTVYFSFERWMHLFPI